MNAWLVTGHDDAVRLFRDHRRFSSQVLADETFGPWYRGAATMLGSDPPEHDRLRGALRGVFTHRALLRWVPRVRELTARMLADRSHDFVAEVARRLPALVTAELVGISDDDVPVVAGLVEDMAVCSVAGAVGDTATRARGVEAGFELADLVAAHLEQRSARRAEVVGALLAAQEQGVLTRPEVVATCVLLLLAATDTTSNLLANAVVLLAEHPEERLRLIGDPTLMPTAVEEVLRFCGPAQFDPRMATENVTIGDATVAAGETIWILTTAAGRDPARFEQPDRFDVGRDPNPHLGFGHGIHLCLGAALARLEARTVLDRLLDDSPDFTVDAVDYGAAFFIRGPRSLRLHR